MPDDQKPAGEPAGRPSLMHVFGLHQQTPADRLAFVDLHVQEALDALADLDCDMWKPDIRSMPVALARPKLQARITKARQALAKALAR